jgi:hypothetical protein
MGMARMGMVDTLDRSRGCGFELSLELVKSNPKPCNLLNPGVVYGWN